MNIFTATMPIWIGVLIVAPFILLAIACLVAAWQFARRFNRQLDAETEAFRFEQECGRLNTENANLQDLLTKRNEQIQEVTSTVKLLDLEIERLQKSADHATIPLQEAAPLAYNETKAMIEQAAATSAPKRTTRKSKAGQS